MLYKFIVYFLISIVINTLWDIDMSFILMSFMLSLICLIGHHVLYIKDIVKDIIKDIALHVLLIFMSFILSHYLIEFDQAKYYTQDYANSLYKIQGIVRDVSLRDNLNLVSLQVKNITDLSENMPLNSFPEYIKILVSPVKDVSVYDEMVAVGEIEKLIKPNNLRTGGEKQFIESGKFEKLFLNSKFHITNIKSIIINKYDYETHGYWENTKYKFYETSEAVKQAGDKYIKDPYLGIAKGITYGDQDNINKDVKQVFINSSLIHIMVLSGANVSFIILILFYLLKYVPNISQKIKVLITIIFSFLFVLGTGLTAPSLRATIMVNSNILSEYFSKDFKVLNSLLLSLFILSLINPHALLYSPSLHLSYLAISGLVFVSPIFYKKLGIVLSTFFGILFAVGPYLIALSGQINLLGIIASMLLEPIIVGVTILTFLTTIFAFTFSFLANLTGILDTVFVSLVLNSAEFLAKDIFIIHTQINFTFVKIYYLFLIIWIYYFHE